jgi:hypothetical protein
MLAALVFTALLLGHVARAADGTGTWLLSVETPAGSGTSTLTLLQKGESLSGTYKGELGEAPVSGTVKGDDIEMQFTLDVQGQRIAVKYTGKIDGASMSGKVSLDQFGEGTFKGSKQKG